MKRLLLLLLIISLSLTMVSGMVSADEEVRINSFISGPIKEILNSLEEIPVTYSDEEVRINSFISAPIKEILDSLAESPVTYNSEMITELMSCLDDQNYKDTMNALTLGEVISNGSYSYTVAGLQQTLVDLGCMISVDGSAGSGTFNALNNILQSIGYNETRTVDDTVYGELLALVLINSNEELADEILPKYCEQEDGSNTYHYVKAALLYAQGKYYRAMKAFEESQYGNWEERAAQCKQSWPSNGEIWHNSNYSSQETSLTFMVNTYDETAGRCFEIYTEDDILVSALFLTGSGSVITWLPGGVYKIKSASGTEWYGVLDAFGKEGYYEFMEFNEKESAPYLTWLDTGYEWIITVNVSNPDPDAPGIESVPSDWESWAD